MSWGNCQKIKENKVSGELMPRRIKSKGNLCLGGKTRRKNYLEEKIWGKDTLQMFTDKRQTN